MTSWHTCQSNYHIYKATSVLLLLYPEWSHVDNLIMGLLLHPASTWLGTCNYTERAATPQRRPQHCPSCWHPCLFITVLHSIMLSLRMETRWVSEIKPDDSFSTNQITAQWRDVLCVCMLVCTYVRLDWLGREPYEMNPHKHFEYSYSSPCTFPMLYYYCILHFWSDVLYDNSPPSLFCATGKWNDG